jgi:hypothetical protein
MEVAALVITVGAAVGISPRVGEAVVMVERGAGWQLARKARPSIAARIDNRRAMKSLLVFRSLNFATKELSLQNELIRMCCSA